MSTARRQYGFLKSQGFAGLAQTFKCGYNIARMKYELILAPEAVEDLKGLKAHARSLVRDAIAEHLRHEPTRVSKSRIKRLRGLSRPQYRLRVGEIRVFYDVGDGVVEVLAIVDKEDVGVWLRTKGVPP